MLVDLLLENKKAIIKHWTDLTIDTYPPEAGSFIRNQKNQFANPVGAAIINGAEALFDWVMSGSKDYSPDVVRRLDDIVRIRAVQQFSASDALGFIFLLKKSLRESIPEKMMKDQHLVGELLRLESRVDSLVLTSFDIYMKCREKLFEMRAMEIRNRTSRILERACMKYGAPHDW
ncbi:MAG: RsbRD N-terminal domain-containing protein [Desulfomonilaceae bacterium]